MVFAFLLVPFVAAVGSAVDFSSANSAKASIAGALDAAVLAGAKDGTSSWQMTAQNVFTATLAQTGATNVHASFSLNNSVYSGTATASVPTKFVGLIGFNTLPLQVTASASGGVDDNACILTLGSGGMKTDSALTLNGAPNINLSNCGLRSNASMNCNGHNGNALASIAVGTVSSCANPEPQSSALPDIYSALASNITLQCGAKTGGATWTAGQNPSGTNVIQIANNRFTEYHVCGSLTVSGTGYLTGSAPATDTVVFIENGSLIVGNTSTVQTARMTIVLTGNNSVGSTIDFPNGNGHASTLALSPSTSANNPWRGIALYQDPKLTTGVDETWGPGATFNADGVVYLPNASLTISGSSASNNSQCTKIVTNTFTTNGSVNLNFAQSSAGCSALGMQQYSTGGLRLTQ